MSRCFCETWDWRANHRKKQEASSLPDFFLARPWPGVAVWCILYISDFVLTVTCARLYKRGVADKIVFEGSFELNPFFQRDIDSLSFVSPRFLATLVLNATLLVIIWALEYDSLPDFYAFVLGASICLQLAVHVRHLRNLFLFRAMRDTEVIRGRIEYTRPLILRMSSVEFLAFSGLYGVLFVFTKSWFVLGGTFACFLTAGKHWWLARKHVARKPS
jgi:hypothetical protein